MTTQQAKMIAELDGIESQIHKGHFLNVHFRAFQLANESWQEHIRQNAVSGSRQCHSPAGAVLDNERGDVESSANNCVEPQCLTKGTSAINSR